MGNPIQNTQKRKHSNLNTYQKNKGELLAVANFNYDDPRYQRDIQRAQAKASVFGNRAKTEPISAAHAVHQLGRQEQFKSLALRSGLAKNQHDLNLARLNQSDKMRGLATQRLNLRKRMFKDTMDREEDNMDWTIGFGIANLGIGGIEGMRRKKILQADLAQKEMFMRDYENMIGSIRQENYFRRYGRH
jgi:hypothetical protein